MADPKPEKATITVTEHPNIYAALSAFQGENPEIIKDKDFGKPGDTMHFKYAALDSFLAVVRPLLYKHGLAVVHEGEDGKIRCALYHTTYKRVEEKAEEYYEQSGARRIFKTHEEGVIRSLPIKVAREGKMQDIGKDSTYARRYTLAEVLGIASDEDTDAEITKKSGENAQSAMYQRAKKGIDDAKTPADVEKAVKVLKSDLAMLEKGKAPSLGLKKEQYEELIGVAEKKVADLDANQGQGAA